MSIRCSKCKREYDVTLFEFGREIICVCGNRLGLKNEEICQQYDLKLEEGKLLEIKRASDRIAFFILNTDYPEVDIEIEKAKFKDLIMRLFPDKVHLYELIYESRFKRLWEQFRKIR